MGLGARVTGGLEGTTLPSTFGPPHGLPTLACLAAALSSTPFRSGLSLASEREKK